MAWRDVLHLLEMAGGDAEKIDREKFTAAVKTGPGQPDMQLRIAKVMYRRKYIRKNNRQHKWEFG